jgi:nucleoside-triphosphatase
MKNLLFTGKPGIGKTTLVKNIIKNISINSYGFYTEEIREKGKRVGFKIVDLQGKEGVLAHVKIKTKIKVSKYGVNLKVLEKIAIPAMEKGMKEGGVIIIDEIGKMELYSINFRKTLFQVLSSSVPVIGTILQKYHPVGEEIKRRQDVKVIEITEKNRDFFLKIIKERKFFHFGLPNSHLPFSGL